MSFARAILTILVAMIVTAPALAQIRIIPREKRDSVANPASLQSADMHFPQGGTIDFGSVAEDGGVQSRVVKWNNKGSEAITITRIATSCSCLRCDYKRGVVWSGESGEISISYNPEGRIGSMRHRLFVYTNRSDQMPTAILDVKGTVAASANRAGDYRYSVGELLLRQREIRIDDLTADEQRVSIACMNGSKSALTPRLDTLLSSKGFTLRCTPQTLKPGEEGDLTIGYRAEENHRRMPLRLFIENNKVAPRDREIKIVTE